MLSQSLIYAQFQIDQQSNYFIYASSVVFSIYFCQAINYYFYLSPSVFRMSINYSNDLIDHASFTVEMAVLSTQKFAENQQYFYNLIILPKALTQTEIIILQRQVIQRMNFFSQQPEYKRLGLKGTDSPLKKSSSVSGLIHGDPATSALHYIDSLQRFKRDYATIDREERQKKKQKQNHRYDMRRQFTQDRQQRIKRIEQQNVAKLQDIQRRSLSIHQHGMKRSAHDSGIPINPITLEYQKNMCGKVQFQHDNQKKLDKLVRAHRIQTYGSSGYNIINGGPSVYVESLVPENAEQQFHQKLNRYYDKFRIKAPSAYQTNNQN